MNPLPARLLIITDRHQAVRPLPRLIEEVLAAGARWMWLRDRDLAARERAALATELAAILRAAGGCLSVGGDVELAAAVKAAGVHLSDLGMIAPARRRLGAGALVGISAHSVAEVGRAAAAGADYACLSPIYATASKPGYGPELGPAAIEAAARFGLPVLALGGVDAWCIAECLAAGASGVAVMGAVMRGPEPRHIVAGLLEKLAGLERPQASTRA